MKYLLFILLPLAFSCHKEDPINPVSPAKDTVVVFQVWGSVPNTVNLTFTQGTKQWTKAISYNAAYSFDNPLDVVIPVPGVKPVGAYVFKIESTSFISCPSGNDTLSFRDNGSNIRVVQSCGGLVD
jgi:hypothetical protein